MEDVSNIITHYIVFYTHKEFLTELKAIADLAEESIGFFFVMNFLYEFMMFEQKMCTSIIY